MTISKSSGRSKLAPKEIIARALSTVALAAICQPLIAQEPSTTTEKESPPAVESLDPPAPASSTAHNLVATDDALLLTWLQPDGEGHVLAFSAFNGQKWTPPREITKGAGFISSWADLPEISKARDGTLYAHWLEAIEGDGHAYGAVIAKSSDGGDHWQNLGFLHDDRSAVEHGFVSYAQRADGAVQAFWLDGRKMTDGGDTELRTAIPGGAQPPSSTVLDARVCECCATDAATTAEGPLIVYRDRSDNETRDIAAVRATADGWSEPVVIHDDGWQINGCPVNGPAVDAHGEYVVVAWYTAADASANVLAAFSRDSGKSFSTPIVVDEAKPRGRVDVAINPNGTAVVTWVSRTNGETKVAWREVARSGVSGAVQILGPSAGQKLTGMPRIARWNERVLVVWGEGGESSQLRGALVRVP